MTSYDDAAYPLYPEIRRRTWDVFISYAREDRNIAQRLAQVIGDRGFSVWLDNKLKDGDPLAEIDQALRSSGAMVVLLSPQSLSSHWVSREVAAALDSLSARRVFPVAIGVLNVRSLPQWLADRQWLYCYNEQSIDKLVDELLPSLEAALGGHESTAGTARVIGQPPPREPLVGVDEYLSELRSQRKGVTWLVGRPGMGKTKLVREYAFQVRNEVDFICWLSAIGVEASSELEQQLRSVEEQITNDVSGLIVVDGLDATGDDARESMAHLARLGMLHRVLVTTRRISNSRFMQPNRYTIMTVGPLSEAAVNDYLDVFAPELTQPQRSRLGQIAQFLGGSPLLLRLIMQALQWQPVDEVLSDITQSTTIIDRTLRILLGQLSEDERHRLYSLAFCPGLLTRVRTDSRWTLGGDETLLSKLISWGICMEQGGRIAFAHQSIGVFLRRTATRRALEDAISYVSARLPDPDGSDARQLLTGVVDLTELPELDWDNDTSANLAELLIWQASVWRSVGEPERAEPLCPRALLLAEQSEQTLLRVRAMNLQSALAFDQGRVAEAGDIERRAADLAISELGPRHPLSFASLANLATSMRAQGELPEAITLLRRVVAETRESLPHGHPNRVTACSNLAVCLREAGLPEEAMPLLREAIDQTTNDKNRLYLDQVLTALFVDLGRLGEASEVLTESIAKAEGSQSANSPDLLAMYANLAALYSRLGRYKEGLSLQSQVIDRFEVLLGPDHPSTLNARSNYAMLLSETGALSDAFQLYTEVATSRAKVLGSDHPDTLQSWMLAARTAGRIGDYERGIEIYENLLTDALRVHGPEHAFTFTVREELAQQLDRAGDMSGARLTYRELLADITLVLPPEHPMVRRVEKAITRYK